MKLYNRVGIILCVTILLIPSTSLSKNIFMGGKGVLIVDKNRPDDDKGGRPDTIDGPTNDNMSDAGKLYGDLYKILRHQGVAGETKLIPLLNNAGLPDLNEDGIQPFEEVANVGEEEDYPIVGGEPVLTVIDAVDDTSLLDYGWYAAETGEEDPDGNPIYEVAKSPYPAQCVQPVANYARWGDISAKTGLTKNRLPMVITYDATWDRSECEVGQLAAVTLDPDDPGQLLITIDEWFIEPCLDEYGQPIEGAVCGTWPSPVAYDEDGYVILGEVPHPYGVRWVDMVEEVPFGRLNITRAPDVVLQAAFDEAVNMMNSADTVGIGRDASGRLLLTLNLYDPLLVDPLTGLPLWLETTKKAIDSPLANAALYAKLMVDGHLVTPGNERMPIDRSLYGGIPILKMLELEDGPAEATLRPTIDIEKLIAQGLESLVDVTPEWYLTYYICVNVEGEVTTEVPCLIQVDGESVANPAVDSRELEVVPGVDINDCPDEPYDYDCDGPFWGIMDDDDNYANNADFDFAASFLAAAADKTGHISPDLVVYLNSIMGINKVVGTSADGEIDYEDDPVYFNYSDSTDYDRSATFVERGPVKVLVPYQTDTEEAVLWAESEVPVMDATIEGITIFENLGVDLDSGFPDGTVPADNVFGFSQRSDDDLSVINFVHTFKIPKP